MQKQSATARQATPEGIAELTVAARKSDAVGRSGRADAAGGVLCARGPVHKREVRDAGAADRTGRQAGGLGRHGRGPQLRAADGGSDERQRAVVLDFRDGAREQRAS
jgi:hypothetical protein